MRHIIALVVISSLAAGTHRMLAAEQSSNGKCAELTSLRLPDVKVSEAVAVPAASTGPIRAAHCRVTGIAGTEIRFGMRVFGSMRTARGIVSEPQPGRVLVESYPETGDVTTFSASCFQSGRCSRWRAKRGSSAMRARRNASRPAARSSW